MAEARTASASGTGRGVQGDDDMFSSLLNQNKMSPKGKSFTLTAQRRYRNGFSHNSSLFLGIRNDYNKESVRKRTFGIVWPSWAKAEPEDLVCAGLYYTGDGDVTQCFSCGAKIGDWKADDNVMNRHRDANQSCLFAYGQDRNDVRDVYGSPMVHAAEGSSVDDRTKAANPSPNTPAVVPKRPPKPHHKKFGNMQEERNRIRTFDHTWQADDLMASVEDIAAAGLYFSGNERRVVCPFCGSQVDLLNPLCEPLEEHRKKSANCSFLRTLAPQPETSNLTDWKELPSVIVALSMDFEESVIHRAVKRLKRKNTSDITSCLLLDEIFAIVDAEETSSTSEDEKENEELSPDLLELREKTDRMRTEITCKACHASRVNTLLLPCGHVALCEDCAEDAKICPISTCGKKILGSVKTFMV